MIIVILQQKAQIDFAVNPNCLYVYARCQQSTKKWLTRFSLLQYMNDSTSYILVRINCRTELLFLRLVFSSPHSFSFLFFSFHLLFRPDMNLATKQTRK